MKPIPLLDYVGSPIFVFLFALLLFLQWKLDRPAERLPYKRVGNPREGVTRGGISRV